jgi:hypothetical protein
MPDTKYQIFHGWVEDIEKAPAADEEYRLLVRQEEGPSLEFAMGQPGSPLKLGDEVSLAVDRAWPTRVLSIVDHSTGEGSRFPCNGGRWFTGTDWLVIAGVAGILAVALAWTAVPAFAAFVLGYGLIKRRSRQARRQREAARFDYLLDRGYFRWRAELDRKREAP